FVFLVDDRIDRHRGFTGLAVTDDQFTLSTPDGNHRVDGFHAGLHGFVNGFTLNDAGRFGFDAAFEVGFDGTLSVDRLTERVHNAAEERGPNGHFDDAAGTFDRVAFFDFGRVTEERDPDVVLFEVQDHALN